MAKRKNPEDCVANREVIYIDDELKEAASLICEKRKMSFSAFCRLSIKHFIKYIETELSKQNQVIDSSKACTNSAQPGSLSNEQMQIIIAVADLLRSQSGDRRKSPRIK